MRNHVLNTGGTGGLSEDFRKERSRTLVLRISNNFFRTTSLNDLPRMQEGDLITHFAGESDLVRHHNHRHSAFRESTHYVEYLADEFGVER